MSEGLFTAYHDLHLLNNCFNDGGFGHYGFKMEGTWFFITHNKNNFSLPLFQTDFWVKNKDTVGVSYLTTLANVAPNVIKFNMGTIRKGVIGEYQRKYLGKK